MTTPNRHVPCPAHLSPDLQSRIREQNGDFDAIDARRAALNTERASLLEALKDGTCPDHSGALKRIREIADMELPALIADEIAALRKRESFAADLRAADTDENTRNRKLATEREKKVRAGLAKIGANENVAARALQADAELRELKPKTRHDTLQFFRGSELAAYVATLRDSLAKTLA
jgi:hypothetical protein